MADAPSLSPSPKNVVLSATERALSIPEILERILSFLPGKARDRVGTLVCKSWHALLCCQYHENHHRYPRQLVHNVYSKDWRTTRQSHGYTHDKTSAIGSARGGLFDVCFGSWTDQVAPPKFEFPDVPRIPKAARKNQVVSKARDAFAYPVKPCILQSAQCPTRLSPRAWQHRNDWGHLSARNQIRGLAFVVPDPMAERATWLDYLDGIGALRIILTGDNSCMAEHGPMPTSGAADRWHARKDLLEALRHLSKSDSSLIANNNHGYKPRENFALLELEILYLDLTYPRLRGDIDDEAGTPATPNEAPPLPPGHWWPGDASDEPVATGDDYEMFLRPLTSIPGVSCHLQRLVLKHLMVWPGSAQSSSRRRKGRRTQRQKKGEGLEDDEGLFPIGPILKTCRQLEELTIEVDDQCAKVGRQSDWPHHWRKPKVTLVLFIDGACDEEDGGEMIEPEIVDVSKLGDDPDYGQHPYQPPEILSGLKLRKLRLKDVHLPEVVLQSLIRASPCLSDLWIQAPMTARDVPSRSSLLTEDLIEPRHDFGPNVTCDQMGFFRDLGAQWPQLTKLHFSKSGYRYTAAQMRTILKAFPNTNRWAIGWKDLGDGILEDLNRIIAKSSLNRSILDREEHQIGSSNNNSGQSLHRAPGLYSNFLTSLDIVPAKDWSPQWGDVMHVFLCEAWHLESLRAGSIGCYLDNLDLNNVLQTESILWPEGSIIGDAGGGSVDEDGGPFSSTRRWSDSGLFEPEPKAVWACRNLKHLQIEFTRRRTPRRSKYLLSRRRLSSASSQSGGVVVDGPMAAVGSWRRNTLHLGEFLKDEEIESDDPEKASRVVFGYLARFCPRLQEVSIRCYELTLNLRGGFTILTRIKTLQAISIVRFTKRLEERDVLPWVIKKRTALLSPTETTTGSLTRGLGRFLEGVGLNGFNRPGKIMERATGVARRWMYQRQMRKLRRESESELRAIFGKGGMSGAHKAENTDRTGNGFSNTKGAHWMCTVSKECYKDLGYLQDVVHALSDLVESEEPKTDLLSKTRPLFGDNDAETWPDLVRLRFIYIDEPFQRRFIAPLLRQQRPELDFEWENWNHDDRT